MLSMLMLASISRVYMFLIISLVPLHKPLKGFIFRSSIIGKFLLIFKLWGGRPGTLNEFKNSVGNLAWSESFKTESNDFISIACSGIKSDAISFNSSAFLLVGVNIVLPE